MNYVLYALLSVSFLATIFSGKRTALYAAILLMPTLQVLPSPLGIVCSPSTLIILALVRLAFAPSRGDRARRSGKALILPVVTLLLTFAIGLGIGAGTEPSGVPFLEALRDTWYWTIPFVLYLLMLRIDVDEPEAKRLIFLCQLSMGLECALTVWEAASGVGRATAHLGDPNMAGAYFAATSAFFLVWLVGSEGRNRKLAFLGGCVAATVALFNTVSRGGLLACAVAMLLVGSISLLAPGRALVPKVASVVLAVLLAISLPYVVPEKVKARVLGTVHEEVLTEEDTGLEANAQERVDYWWFAWDLFRDRPAGIGAFEFPALLATHFKYSKQTHNIYLELLVEQGIQGLLAFLFLLGATFRLLATKYRSHDRRNWRSVLALSLIGWFTAHCVAHFFVNSFFNINTTGQFWMLVALLASSGVGPARGPVASVAPSNARSAGRFPSPRSPNARKRTGEPVPAPRSGTARRDLASVPIESIPEPPQDRGRDPSSRRVRPDLGAFVDPRTPKDFANAEQGAGAVSEVRARKDQEEGEPQRPSGTVGPGERGSAHENGVEDSARE